MKAWPALFLVVLSAACGDSVDPPATENRFFERPLSNCPTENPEVNCAPSVELCIDGSAIIAVTDILNGGSYTEQSGIITLITDGGDVPETIIFTPINGGAAIVDDWVEVEWTRSTTRFSSCSD